MAESKITVAIGGEPVQIAVNVQPASVAGPKGDPGISVSAEDAGKLLYVASEGVPAVLGLGDGLAIRGGSLVSSGGSGGGLDGGYYIPSVDPEGNLSWEATDSDMPSVEGANIKGPAGADGSDADVTYANVTTALGYVPADADELVQLSETLDELKNSGGVGEDGGYYIPSVDSEGNLSWQATSGDMPAVEAANIMGMKGDTGAQGPQGEKGDKGDKGDTGDAGSNGADGESVTITDISESADDGGENRVTFSDGSVLTVKNGAAGAKGDTGEAGHTPVKGTDYFTEADKSEMVDAVLAALPAAEGGSY